MRTRSRMTSKHSAALSSQRIAACIDVRPDGIMAGEHWLGTTQSESSAHRHSASETANRLAAIPLRSDFDAP